VEHAVIDIYDREYFQGARVVREDAAGSVSVLLERNRDRYL
jgi:hypothetical protein